MTFREENIRIAPRFKVLNYLSDIGMDQVRNEIIKGLKSDQKYISPKFFYDKNGSNIFEDITKLEEYYPTRTEKQILSSLLKNIDVDFKDLDIIELGSGDSSKIKILLSQIPPILLETINYFPIDISQSALEKSVKDLSVLFNLKNITGIVLDFHRQLNIIPRHGRRLFCFLGSTIGNFSEEEIQDFMNLLGKEMQQGDSLILGLDMIKDIDTLELAYNDKLGVTAEFNLNILNVVNKLIESNFNPSDFEHIAFFNQEKSRIEMHLMANKNLEIRSKFTKEPIKIKQGEKIHTENSHKFTISKIKQIANWAGLTQKSIYIDNNAWFNIVHFVK